MKKIVKNGGVLNLNNDKITLKHYECNEEQCERIKRFITILFEIYKSNSEEEIKDNKWYKIEKDNIYVSFKKERYGRRVIIGYREFLKFGSKTQILDLLHISLNDGGNMHLTFDNFDVSYKIKPHIYSIINPDIQNGIKDLIEFIFFIKDNPFNTRKELFDLLRTAILNEESGWRTYLEYVFEKLKKNKPDIKKSEALMQITEIFKEKYYEVLEKFIISLNETDNKIIKELRKILKK